MRKPHNGAWTERPSRKLQNRSNRLLWMGLAALVFSLGLANAGQLQADYLVYNYHDSGRGGAYLLYPAFSDIHVPRGSLPGPYGGWYDGNSHVGPGFNNSRSPGHPGYNFQFRNGVADIPDYIFDSYPTGYTPATTPYLRLDSWHPTSPIPPYTPPPVPWTTDVGEYDPQLLEGIPEDFLSLPGDEGTGSGNSYVVVGFEDKAISLDGEIIVQQVYDINERANIYVSTKTVADPSTLTAADFVLLGTLNADIAAEPGPVGWIQQYTITLADYGLALPPQALKIEGLESIVVDPDFSVGFDVSSISFDVTDPVYVPEPASLALLGLGVIGLVGIARRRRRR